MTTSVEALIRCPDPDTLRREAWGTKWHAYDGEIISRRPGYLNFGFNTANNIPEAVYRELGKLFPKLDFDIAAIDPGDWWAITMRISGGKVDLDEHADCKEIYERVYKEPFEEELETEG